MCTLTTCDPVTAVANGAVVVDNSNYANSPPLPKFVDALPIIPIAVPTIWPAAGSAPEADYYELKLEDFQQSFHSSLGPAALRGYVQTNGGPSDLHTNNQGYGGPMIVAHRDRPVRLKFVNALTPGKMPLPVDETLMGAGTSGPVWVDKATSELSLGPTGNIRYCNATQALTFNPTTGRATASTAAYPDTWCRWQNFSQNRALLHLHGGVNPWIGDGHPHQWVTPADDKLDNGEAVFYKRGASYRAVPDMPEPADGEQTYYYTNQQNARMMFYHDHAYGLTRLNIYAGEFAPYIVTDDIEQAQLAPTGLYARSGIGKSNLASLNPSPTNTTNANLAALDNPLGTVLVIQDKSFVTAAGKTDTWGNKIGTLNVDPLWASACGSDLAGETTTSNRRLCPSTEGSLYFPHVYFPNQAAQGGLNAKGRWDFGPWLSPATFIFNQVLPTVSQVPEAFMDSMVVNGKAFPNVVVPKKPMRFRILNASNDRYLNLQLYYAVNGTGIWNAPQTAKKKGPKTPPPDDGYGLICNTDGAKSGPTSWSNCTEVGMVRATGTDADDNPYTVPAFGNLTPELTVNIPFDNRAGGVPDPRNQVPFIQIGNDSGILPKPILHTNQAIDYEYDRKQVNGLNVRNNPVDGPPGCPQCNFPRPGYTLFLGPAERADIIIDFGSVPDGATLILYNDAPGAVPTIDPRYDLYTGSPDFTSTGGAWTPTKGFGPNNRTIMQFRVDGSILYNVPGQDGNNGRPTTFGGNGSGQPYFQLPACFVAEEFWGDVTYSCATDADPTHAALNAALATDYPASHPDKPNLTRAYAASDYDKNNNPKSVFYKLGADVPKIVDLSPSNPNIDKYCTDDDQSGCATTRLCGYGTNFQTGLKEFPTCAGATTDPVTGVVDNSNAAGYRKTCGFPVRVKSVAEDFDPIFGRMNALLGTEATGLEPATGQTTFGHYLVDPATETPHDGETEIWNIIHNGVDTHALHIHLRDHQVLGRVDWAGSVKLPDPDERGLKDTVKVNPLENTIIAVRFTRPQLPFTLRNSVRVRDVTTALGVTNPNDSFLFPFLYNIDPVTNQQVSNEYENLSWEYVWHCHLLGHEENDMMRPIAVQASGQPVAVPATTAAAQ